MTPRPDAVVVGAGAFGAWSAWHLQRAGRKTLLLEAQAPGHARSSSGGETRIIRMGYGAAELYSRFARRSLRLWLDLFAEGKRPLFHRTGVLWIAPAEDRMTRETESTLARLGIPHESLAADEVRRRHPRLRVADGERALFEPESGVLMARQAVGLVVEDAAKRGALVRRDGVTPVVSNGRSRLDSVRTLGGETHAASEFVFACGSWLPKVLPDVLHDLIRPTRQEVLFFGPPAADSSFRAPTLPAWIDFAGEEAYGLPDLDGRGLKVGLDRHGPPFDPETGDRLVGLEAVDRARAVLSHRLPEMAGAPLVETRVCPYENTANGDLIVDRHPAFDNVWIAGGGSGHGFKHAPAVGEHLLGLIAKETPPEPRLALAGKGTAPARSVF